jgi:hypothetical protein
MMHHDANNRCVNRRTFIFNLVPEKYGYLTLPITKEDWKTQYYLLYGRCYTFKVPSWMRRLKIEDVTVETRLGTFIFLHHPGCYQSVDTKTKIPGTLGNILFIDVGHEVKSVKFFDTLSIFFEVCPGGNRKLKKIMQKFHFVIIVCLNKKITIEI